jgi:hypothetical protein
VIRGPAEQNSPAQVNELLLKVIAYNITCTIHSIFELGVSVPGMSAGTQTVISAAAR